VRVIIQEEEIPKLKKEEERGSGEGG